MKLDATGFAMKRPYDQILQENIELGYENARLKEANAELIRAIQAGADTDNKLIIQGGVMDKTSDNFSVERLVHLARTNPVVHRCWTLYHKGLYNSWEQALIHMVIELAKMNNQYLQTITRMKLND